MSHQNAAVKQVAYQLTEIGATTIDEVLVYCNLTSGLESDVRDAKSEME